MSSQNKVNDFVRKLDHPLKAEMEAVIQIIRETSTEIDEDVKWSGPSFDFIEPIATINPRMKEYVVLIFHKGELLNDKTGLLESAPKGKAYAKFYSMDDVRKHKAGLQKLLKEWMRLMAAV